MKNPFVLDADPSFRRVFLSCRAQLEARRKRITMRTILIEDYAWSRSWLRIKSKNHLDPSIGC